MSAITTVFAQDDEVKYYEFFKGQEINGLIADGPMNIQLTEDPSNTGVFSSLEDIEVNKTTEGYIRIKVGNEVTKAFASRITVKVNVSCLKRLRLTGKSAVIAKGKFMRSDKVEISMEGSSATADYLDIVANDVLIDMAGLTKLEDCSVDTKFLKITATSTGPKIVISGKADKCLLSTSGMSPNVTLLNCPVQEMDASVAGLSSVRANIAGKASVKVSGSATFRYVGTGVVEGEGNIKPL